MALIARAPDAPVLIERSKATAEAARTQVENQAKALATVAPKADAAAILGLPTAAITTPPTGGSAGQGDPAVAP